MSTSTSFSLDGDTVRPIREDAVEALDDALQVHGEVLHAMDPTRMLRFDAGGPAVWSVGMVRVDGERPYWLMLTYGFSGTLTPVPYREGWSHEYSIAVPDDGGGPPTWAAALLRHLARYVLRSRAELQVGDNMPCNHAITQVAFAREHHGSVRTTEQTGVIVAADPLLGTVQTPAGPIEVRRIVGVLPNELGLIETWNCGGFIGEWTALDPTLLTDPDRETVLVGSLYDRCRIRAAREGGSVGLLFAECGWTRTVQGGIDVHFPGGLQAEQVLRVLHARLPFGREVVLQGPPGGGEIVFAPHDTFGIQVGETDLILHGQLDSLEMQQILSFIRPDAPNGSVVRFGE